MSDPVSDLLARIRNAILSRKTTLEIPSSKIRRRLAEVLRDEGFLAAVADGGDEKRPMISITLRWDPQNKPAISGMRRVSKPGQRRYVPADDVPRVRNGLGVAILSTSKGLMTDRAARKANMGGEVLCEVW
jgi:small subunit ribosomal protein S8